MIRRWHRYGYTALPSPLTPTARCPSIPAHPRPHNDAAMSHILIGEVWRAPFDSQHPYQRSVDAPDRQEALVATLVTKEGGPRQISATIHRDGDTVQLEKSAEQDGGAHYMFAPFYEVWERPIPEEWYRATADAVDKTPEK